MNKGRALIPLAVAFLMLLSACGGGGNPPDSPGPTPLSAGTWTWMSGSNSIGPGIYGTQGVADRSNAPGVRSSIASWVDSTGKLWLFGGFGWDSAGNHGYLNDLWRYDPATSEWTWISGSNFINQSGTYGTQGAAGPANVPGGREGAVSWVDSTGELWLFGGYAYDSVGVQGYINDAWTYNPTTLEWTWVSGSNLANQAGIYGTQGVAAPSNIPGGRAYTVSWRDTSGVLWVFGGHAIDWQGTLGDSNDLWKFDPITLEWTWISGSNDVEQWGVYGTKGVANPSNVPGGRSNAVSWLDSSGSLWLFGGVAIDWRGFRGYSNDLWKFDPINLQWTWVSGNNYLNQSGLYPARGFASSSSVPGARSCAVSWRDSSGKLWLFGGYGQAAPYSGGYLNDLWMYDPGTLEWTWVSGSDHANQPPVYGTQGVPDSANVPGARKSAVCSTGPGGNIWLFGGLGYSNAAGASYLNDLWKYTR